MRERPAHGVGLLSAGIIAITLSIVVYVLVRTLVNQPIGLGMALTAFLLVVALVFLGRTLFRVGEMLSLLYTVDRNGISIRTMFSRQTIPHSAILRIEESAVTTGDVPLHGMSWPGYMRGSATVEPYGNLSVWATEPLERQLVLVGEEISFGISPSNHQRFVEACEARRNLGPLTEPALELAPAGIATWPVWRDRSVWLGALVGAILDAGLATLTLARYRALPTIIPLHWNALGQPDRLAAKSGVFAIPAIGAGVLLLSLAVGMAVHSRERMGARLMVWGSIGVQVALWAAAWQILIP